MKLLVGLGNPGKDYEYTRHNVGFLLIDAIAEATGVNNFSEKFGGQFAKTSFKGEELLLFKPMSYMNNSGLPTAACRNFYKLPLRDLIVAYDDIDLRLGQLKCKVGGGSGGHNGIKSLDSHIGPDYMRLRFGIGHPGSSDMVANYVLHPFGQAEFKTIQHSFEIIMGALSHLLKGDSARFLNECAMLGSIDGA
jgi:PTH1 family peptidyl-tRNA hydrolase